MLRGGFGQDGVTVKELKLSQYNDSNLFFAIYPYYGDLGSVAAAMKRGLYYLPGASVWGVGVRASSS